MVPGAPEPGQQGPGKTVIWTIAAVVAALGVAIAVLGVYVVDSYENSVGPVSSLFSDDDDSGSDSGTGAYGDVSAEVSYAGGVVTLQGEDTAADAPVVDIFLDFSCPYCADLAASSHEDLSDALVEGSAGSAPPAVTQPLRSPESAPSMNCATFGLPSVFAGRTITSKSRSIESEWTEHCRAPSR